MVRWIGLFLMTQTTYVNHRQTNKQTEIINRLQKEHRAIKLVIILNWGKINAIVPE